MIVFENISIDYEAMAGAIKKKKNREKAKELAKELNRRSNKTTKWFNEEMRKLC